MCVALSAYCSFCFITLVPTIKGGVELSEQSMCIVHAQPLCIFGRNLGLKFITELSDTGGKHPP